MAQPALQLNIEATDIVQAYTDDCRECALALAPERTVNDPRFSWDTWDIDQQYEAVKNLDLTDRRSAPNERDYSSHQETAQVNSYALMSIVPQDDVVDAKSKNTNLDPINHAAESLARELWRLRLQRIMDLYRSPSSYAAGNVYDVPSGERLNTDTNWVKLLLAQRDKMLLPPNVIVFSNRATWTAFRTHSSIVEAIKLTGAGKNDAVGTVQEQAVAELFEVERVIVCRNLVNTSPKIAGQSQPKGPISTENFIAFALLDPISRLEGTVPSFIMTAVYRPLQAFTVFDPLLGVEGATKVKVAWRGKEIIKSRQAGFLLRNVL
jgi:hypothetical protein